MRANALRPLATAVIATLSVVACTPKPDAAKPGALHSAAQVGADGTVDRGELSDPAAVLHKLEAVAAKAPPVDAKAAGSVSARSKAYAAERDKAIGTAPRLWFVLRCGAAERDPPPLAYDPATRNLRVKLYTATSADAAKVGLATKVLSAQSAVYQRVLSILASGMLPPETVDVSDKEATEALDELQATASTLTPAGGPVVAVVNSPLSGLHVAFLVDESEVHLAWSKARLQLIRDQEPKALSEVIQGLAKAKVKWSDYPDALLPDGSWRASVPYTGDPKDACLAAGFDKLDLARGGEYATPFIGNQAKLVGELAAWTIYDAKSGRVKFRSAPLAGVSAAR